MPKIKSVQLKDIKDAKKMTEGVNKVLKLHGLDKYVKCKTPADAWITANAPDGKLDIILEATIDVKSHQGPIKVYAKAANKATSVMGIYTMPKALDDALMKNLKSCGLI